MSLKPICVRCQRFYRPKRNAIDVLEGMPIGNARPGLADADKWKPYKLWSADLWACEGCGHELVSGAAREPFAEHYKEEFSANLERCISRGRLIKVNDC